MSELNPYAPPASSSNDDGGGGRYDDDASIAELRRIATYQRHLNLSVAAYLGFSAFASVNKGEPTLACVIGILALAVVLASVISTVRLANALYGVGWAVVCGILLFVPCAGLIAMLVLSQGATRRLRAAGYQVGLLGADPTTINARDHGNPYRY